MIWYLSHSYTKVCRFLYLKSSRHLEEQNIIVTSIFSDFYWISRVCENELNLSVIESLELFVLFSPFDRSKMKNIVIFNKGLLIV